MRRYTVEVGGRTHTIDVEEVTAERFRVRVGDHEFELKLSQAEDVPVEVVTPHMAGAAPAGARLPRPPMVEELARLPRVAPPPLLGDSGSLDVRAPMPGTVVSVEVRPGGAVRRGEPLVRLEAMKMINHVRAPRDGVVAEVRVEPGQSVAFGDPLVTFERSAG
jgi:biotin carboxyl carrier protein